jgi:hypothetical protein
VKPEQSVKFAKEFSLDDDPGYIVYEHSDRLAFLAKLFNKHVDEEWSQSSELKYFEDQLKSEQMSRGDFSISDYSISGPLWFFAQKENISDELNRSIKYLLSEYPKTESSEYPFQLINAAVGAVALSEIDYKRYHEEIKGLLDWIEKSLEKYSESTNFIRLELLSYCLLAFSECSSNTRAVVSDLKQELKDAQEENGSWDDDVQITGLVTAALIHAGEGPKISAVEATRRLNRERQKRKKSRPVFISTIPSTRTKHRTVEILENSKRMINNSQDIIRISSLRIDVLYEDIIDRIEEDNLEVRILTNTGSASGPRTKLKKAAMNELVKRTDGNVKEDELIHSRFMTSDDQRLLTSSADLTREQLYEEFNTGIYTQDTEAVNSAIQFFDDVWRSAEHRDVK